jgi:hypothetical protein
MLGRIKTCNFTKTEHILCIENKIVKDSMITFLNWHWIYEDFKVNLEKIFL